jgi:predicted  nucleic acid-binding Zn-ribbon protein
MELFDIVADATKTMAESSRAVQKTNDDLRSLSAEIDDVARLALQRMEELRMANIRVTHLKSDVSELKACLREAMADARENGMEPDCHWYQWARSLVG